MQVYQGKGILSGIVMGKIHVYRREESLVYKTVSNTITELERFRHAKEIVTAQLDRLQKKAAAQIGSKEAEIFEVHRMILDDDDFSKTIEKQIQEENFVAEYAVNDTAKQLTELFSKSQDPYMKERAADVKDIAMRLLSVLTGKGSSIPTFDEPGILVANDLTPSEMVLFDSSKILAIILTEGSEISHAAILAKTMGIPIMIQTKCVEKGTENQTDWAQIASSDGEFGIADTKEGLFFQNPDETELQNMKKKQIQFQKEKEVLEEFIGKEDVTKDGKSIRLHANIGNLSDLETAIKQGASGIGLFRSEFLFIGNNQNPTEEEQFFCYRKAAKMLNGKPVIVRTVDLGADKEMDYPGLIKEENPALGCRGIRRCLAEPELFRIQLRALFRAAVFGDLSIMYPMITSENEIMAVRSAVKTAEQELKREGYAYRIPRQGIMIETPAAVMISDELAKHADFFSIGTNDLTQYTLAADRQNPAALQYYDPRHPAVLRMIRLTVENAHKAGIPVGICGDLGADPSMTELFLRMGVDELSVPPASVLNLRKIIRTLDLKEKTVSDYSFL